MIDLHCHILPGIDDGPDTLEGSLELCRLAVADGVTHAIATPHIHPGRWENSRQSIERDFQLLQSALTKNNIPLQLGFAGEVRITDQIMQQVGDNQIPFYGEMEGYNIMLLEFPHGHITPGSEKLVEWLLQRGIRPLIAHPERNKQVMKDVSRLYPFLELGCWLQLTGGAVIGEFGKNAKALADKLLQGDFVTVIASDGHNTRSRPPRLKQAFNTVARVYGEDRAQRLMLHAPAAITVGQFALQDLMI